MISSSQIRNELAIALAGVIPLHEFEDWFVLNTWNIHKGGSRAAEILTFAIQEALSEYTSGHVSESQLRQELEQILQSDTRNVQITYEQGYATKPALSFRASPSVPSVRVRPLLAQP